MSDARAIAAVTMTLRGLLLARIAERDPGLNDIQVTTLPPDQARRGITAAQLNLFLYQAQPSATWRGLDPRSRGGDPAFPPLAFDLSYLLTAWGRGEGDSGAVSHRVLGAALAVLHDAPLLDGEALQQALAPEAPLPPFPERRVRLSLAPLGIEELSKLWTAFQTGYRLSAAVEATVVLIESQRPARSAPPVLRRGEDDRGPSAFAEGPPLLERLRPPGDRPAAEPGETLRIEGRALASGPLLAVLTPLVGGGTPVTLETEPASDGQRLLRLVLPPGGGTWRAGLWSLALRRPREARPDGVAWAGSGVLPLVLAPVVHDVTHTLDATGLEVTLLATPPLAEDQGAALLVGGALAPAPVAREETTLPTTGEMATRLTFRLPRPPEGKHAVRLRLRDAAGDTDSQPFRRDPQTGLLGFDPAQVIEVPA